MASGGVQKPDAGHPDAVDAPVDVAEELDVAEDPAELAIRDQILEVAVQHIAYGQVKGLGRQVADQDQGAAEEVNGLLGQYHAVDRLVSEADLGDVLEHQVLHLPACHQRDQHCEPDKYFPEAWQLIE